MKPENCSLKANCHQVYNVSNIYTKVQITHDFQSQYDVKESVTKIYSTSVPMQNVLFNVDSIEIQVYECGSGEYIYQ